jgi:alpha-beta hydrolase superfamily lysophospholipase
MGIAAGDSAVRIPATSLYRDTHAFVTVERIDATDWRLSSGGKRYDVLTDAEGRMLSATLPDYGVTIERRIGFMPAAYPPWPAYAPPPDGAYRADSVRIAAPEGHSLAATLTVPKRAGPFAAAVLVTGISPHERNQGDPPFMPFRNLADALTRAGIAVLRVDDRGVGASSGDRASSTTFDEVNDVHTEIAWLRAHRDIDRRRILVMGLSEGGLIAPMVAATDSALAGIVTLAGPGVSGDEVARYQIVAAVMADSTIAPSARAAEIQKQLSDSLNARERSYMSIDPLAWARRVRCPALIVHGGSDLHVPPRSAERLAWAMRSNGNRDVTVRVFPGLSHTLLPDPLGLATGWAALPGFMTSPELLRAVADWATAHTAAAGSRAHAAR